ncbi:MAG: YdeI/OmpD-associated family protein [archaeon]
MEIKKSLYVITGKEWRAWLKKNHFKEKELWLVYYRKASGKPRISYNAAVDEALCYGWIDSTVKKVDEDSFAQRFTPRRPTSQLSELNRERVRRLIKQNKMTPVGLKAIKHVFGSKKEKKFVVPREILKRIKKEPDAWKNFKKLPSWYKQVRISYIGFPETEGKEGFEKRLKYFVKMTAKNKRFGFVRD